MSRSTAQVTAHRARITARKWQGDDAGSWAVFMDGRLFVCGLTKAEVPYYKKQAKAIISTSEEQAHG